MSSAGVASIGEYWLEESQRETLERGLAPEQRCTGHLGRRTRQHGCAADPGGLDPGGLRHRFRHHSTEGTLAQLAEHQLGQEAAFVLRGSREERAERVVASHFRTLARDPGDLIQVSVDLEQLETRLGRRGSGVEIAKRGPSQANLSLRQYTGQVVDTHLDLVRAELTQERRQAGLLLLPRAGPAHLLRGPDELFESHFRGNGTG